MTVKQLIELLKKYPGYYKVVIEDTHEECVFPIVDTHDIYNSYDPHTNEYGISSLTPDLIELGYTDSSIVKGKKCVILQSNFL